MPPTLGADFEALEVAARLSVLWKAAAVLHDGLPGAAVGPPPTHQHSHISTAEAALIRDFGIIFESASSVCMRRSKARGRLVWCACPLGEAASN